MPPLYEAATGISSRCLDLPRSEKIGEGLEPAQEIVIIDQPQSIVQKTSIPTSQKEKIENKSLDIDRKGPESTRD